MWTLIIEGNSLEVSALLLTVLLTHDQLIKTSYRKHFMLLARHCGLLSAVKLFIASQTRYTLRSMLIPFIRYKLMNSIATYVSISEACARKTLVPQLGATSKEPFLVQAIEHGHVPQPMIWMGALLVGGAFFPPAPRVAAFTVGTIAIVTMFGREVTSCMRPVTWSHHSRAQLPPVKGYCPRIANGRCIRVLIWHCTHICLGS